MQLTNYLFYIKYHYNKKDKFFYKLLYLKIVLVLINPTTTQKQDKKNKNSYKIRVKIAFGRENRI